MAEHEAYVRCWNNTDGSAPSHFITITDNCPCVQYSETTGNQVPRTAPAAGHGSRVAGLGACFRERRMSQGRLRYCMSV